MDKRITVKIDPMGNTTVEAQNFAGQGCTDATAPIENALSGNAGVERALKSEYHEIDNTGSETEHVTF